MTDPTSPESEGTKSYYRRWVILALTTVYLVAVGYGRACFGVVENVYAEYYHVSVDAVDWLTLSLSGVSALISFLFLFLLPLESFRFKFYCRLASACLVVSFGCHLASAFFRNLYVVALLGQLVMGIVGGLAVIIIPEVAALWFPSEEAATAVGISLGGIAVGNMIGFLLPSHLLQRDENESETTWALSVKARLSVTFSVLLGISVATMIGTVICVKNAPTLPPSLSEAAKRQSKSGSSSEKPCSDCAFRYLKLVCTDATFVTLVICFGVVETAYMLEVLMIADILRYTRSEKYYLTKSNVLASYYLSSYAIGALLGSITSGLVLDKTKRFKEVAIGSGVFMSLFAGGFLIAVIFKTIPWSLATNFLYGIFNGACYTCLYEIIVQHMYPCNEMALGAWITTFVSLSAVIVPSIGRQIFKAVSQVGVLILQAIVLALATTVIGFLKPKYERYLINTGSAESMPLVPGEK